jgi:hypothetical protein
VNRSGGELSSAIGILERWNEGILGSEMIVAAGQTKHGLIRELEKVFDPQNVVKIIAFPDPRRNTASGDQYPFNCKIPGSFQKSNLTLHL